GARIIGRPAHEYAIQAVAEEVVEAEIVLVGGDAVYFLPGADPNVRRSIPLDSQAYGGAGIRRRPSEILEEIIGDAIGEICRDIITELRRLHIHLAGHAPALPKALVGAEPEGFVFADRSAKC